MRRRIIFILLASIPLLASGCRDAKSNHKPAGSPQVHVPITTTAGNVNGLANSSQLPTVPGLEDQKLFVPLADVVANVDPRKDSGWETEAFSERAAEQLKLVGKLLAHPEQRTDGQLDPLIASDFQCATLRPSCEEVFRDDSLVVLRTKADAADGAHADEPLEGKAGFVRAIESLAAPFQDKDPETFHVKFKIIHVELTAEGARTEAYYEASAGSSEGIVQQNARWLCQWTTTTADRPPKLKWVGVEDYEEIHPGRVKRPLFADCTEAVLGHVPSYRDQLAYGADYWYANFDVAFGVHQGNQGLAIGDVNGDGREDVYVCQPAGLPNRLFVQSPDGTLRDISREAGVDWLDLSRSALLVDLDNDGDQDLIVVLKWSMLIHENDGGGHFTLNKIVDTKSNLSSLSAADYDNDGDLDLYVCGYSPGPETAPTDIFANPVPYHDANNGARNFLLRNDGQLDFLDVTEEVGLEQNNRRFSFAAAWEDYDNDGDLDIYVANDFGRNNLYRNDEGLFKDVAAEAGVEDIAAGMSVSWGDYDHDGQMDLYIANMFSSAGNRISYQRRFSPGADEDTLAQLRRHARGNTLFRNLGDGTFADVSVETGVTMGRWAWGSLFTDLNNDGWEDLYVVNGFITTEDTGDL